MSSPGQGIGIAIGAIVGTIILPGLGTAIGAGIGGLIGSLIDPPKVPHLKAKFEEETIQFNTFDHDLPVPILFGRQKWAPNVIYIGDAHSQVETVGTETVAAGKSSEEQDVQKLIYYADFALALCEGPIQRVNAVFREDADISGQEGSFFTIALGASDETVPAIVTNSPRPVALPVPWRHTAKLLFSGRLGEANRLPRILVDATGPDLTVTDAATASVTARVTKFSHDDLTDLLTLVAGDYTVVTCDRQGSNKRTATVPNVTADRVEVAAFDGRTATLMAVSKLDANNLRRILRGERDYGASDLWETTVGTEEAFQYGIDGFTVDDGMGVLWTIHNSNQTGMTLVGTSFADGTQRTVLVPTDDSTGVVIRALWYDKTYRRFYVLYSASTTLRILRFVEDDPGDIDSMEVKYGHQNPMGVCRIGEMIAVFDKGTTQPLHLFEWGRATDRFTFGSLNSSLDFRPTFLSGLRLYFSADSINGLSDGGAIVQWNDDSGHQHQATQGTAAEQPVFRSAVPGFFNRPAVEFDGVDDDFDTFGSSPTLDTSAGCTLTMVIRPLSGAGATGNRIFSMRNTPVPNTPGAMLVNVDVQYGYLLVADPTGVAQFRAGMVGVSNATLAIVAAPVSPGESAIITIRFKQGEAKIWKNGTLYATYTTTTGFGPMALATHNQFALGRWIGYPWTTVDQGHANVQIGEFMAYERALSDSEVEQVNDYLRARYRIAWGPSYGTYLGVGDKLVYGNPQQFLYADGLSRIFILDNQTADTWAVYHHQWNGDGWSVLRETSYTHTMFDEESSAAGAVWHFLKSGRYGAGISDTFLRRYTFERTSGFCNQPVDVRYYQTDVEEFGPRYQVNYLLAARRNLSSCLQEMTTCFNGYMVYTEGLLELHAERDLGVVDGYYGPDNIVDGSFGFQEMAREDRWNEVTVECFDARDNYRRIPVPAIAEWERDVYGEVRRRTIAAVGVTRLRQAGNLAWTALLGFTTRRFACRFTTAAMGLKQAVGDVIGVTRPEIGWDRKLFRIVKITETEEEEISFSCVEHVPRISESNGFPLQTPQALDDLFFGSGAGSNFQQVFEGVRTRTIENTLTGEIWLFNSKPDNSGPWSHMRWHVIWDSSPTSGATFYPGLVPLVSSAYTQVVNTTHFTPSGLLKSSLTSGATSFDIVAVCGTPPESNFDVVIYNAAITSVQFNNPHGNGQYERAQGSSYADATKTVTVQARGVGTPANAHTVVSVAVGAMYTRLTGVDNSNPGVQNAQVSPVPIYYKNQTVPGVVQGSHPLTTFEDEWYIGFDSADFTAGTPQGVNNIRVTVTSNFNLATAQKYITIYEYSTGGGNWKELRIERDETNGYTQSGAISFKTPSDWATSDKWKPSGPGTTEYFPIWNNTSTAPARYYIRIRRSPTEAGAGSNAPFYPTLPGNNGYGFYPREVNLEGAATQQANGYYSPTVYFLVANATPVYNFISPEQGYGLKFKAQPVGVHNQSLDLDSLSEVSHLILNLAGE